MLENIPGNGVKMSGEYWYFLAPSAKIFKKIWKDFTSFTPSRMPSNGAVMNEAFEITTPSNDHFYALYFNGDIPALKLHFEEYAQSIGLNFGWAYIKNDCLIFYDKHIQLIECQCKSI